MSQQPSSSIKIIYDQDNCTTFEIDDEDHTFGNSVRYMILKNPDVLYCGYSMPHPNERKIVMQIQTIKGKTSTPTEALKKGIENLKEMCLHIKETFQTTFDQHAMDDNA